MWDEYVKDLKEFAYNYKAPEIKIPYQLKDIWEKAALDWINKNK